MSSFSKKGLRANKIQNLKDVNLGLKMWTQKFHAMKDLAIKVKLSNNDIVFTEENINDYTKPLLGRDLDNMEKLLVLGTITDVNE